MKSILWVDDEIEKYSKLFELFELNGFSITPTSSISYALKSIRRNDFNNIILDINFYDNHSEGLDFLEEVLEMHPELNIVVYTGYPTPEYELRIIDGFKNVTYLTKSVKDFMGGVEQKIFFQKLHNSFSKEKILKNMKLRTVKIFIASSNKLQEERDKIEQLLPRKNDTYIENNIYLKLDIWEKETSSFSRSRKQSEFNELALKSDIFICIVYDRIGDYTKEELDTVYSHFMNSNDKKKILLYLKDTPIKPSDITEKIITVIELKKDIQAKQQFYSYYDSIDNLLRNIEFEISDYIVTLK